MKYFDKNLLYMKHLDIIIFAVKHLEKPFVYEAERMLFAMKHLDKNLLYMKHLDKNLFEMKHLNKACMM